MKRRISPQPAASRRIDTPSRRQRHSIEFRERLFRAALNLFAAKGFAETTVEDITNAADIGKGTFFNYFPSKDHILLAFGEMQLVKLRDAVENMRQSKDPMPDFMRALSVKMTEEPARSPSVVRAILQANLANSAVRTAMRENHARAHALLTRLVKVGQDRGEFRRDLRAEELAHVFRQTVFGTLLMWSVYEDATLASRINTAFDVLWLGLAPRIAGNRGAGAPTGALEEKRR